MIPFMALPKPHFKRQVASIATVVRGSSPKKNGSGIELSSFSQPSFPPFDTPSHFQGQDRQEVVSPSKLKKTQLAAGRLQ